MVKTESKTLFFYSSTKIWHWSQMVMGALRDADRWGSRQGPWHSSEATASWTVLEGSFSSIPKSGEVILSLVLSSECCCYFPKISSANVRGRNITHRGIPFTWNHRGIPFTWNSRNASLPAGWRRTARSLDFSSYWLGKKMDSFLLWLLHTGRCTARLPVIATVLIFFLNKPFIQ